MRYFLTLILIGLVTASCSPSVSTNANATPLEKPATSAPSGNIKIASIATEGAVTEDVTNGMASSPSTAIVMTVNPTPIPLSPIQGNTFVPAPSPTPISTQGWQTFTSAALGVTVDYPSDWSIAEETDGVTFTSPQGAAVLLKRSPLSGVAPGIIGQRCLSQTNPHNITAQICVETASFFSYTAIFKIKSSDGATHEMTLSTLSRESAAVFEAIFESIRPVQ